MHDLLSGGGEDEGAGAVGALRLARLEARLREERRLLIDRQTDQWKRVAESEGLANPGVAVDDVGLACGLEAEDLTGLLGPRRALKVEQQRPRGRCGVRHEGAREPLVEPGVDGRHNAFVALLPAEDRKSTRLNSSHVRISYADFCLKKKNHPNH